MKLRLALVLRHLADRLSPPPDQSATWTLRYNGQPFILNGQPTTTAAPTTFIYR